MVKRLNIGEMISIVMEVGPKRTKSMSFYGPLADASRLSGAWATWMRAGQGVAFGSYRSGAPKGFLLGLIIPDLYTGEMQGLEHTWACLPGADSLDLLRAFEKECCAQNCKRVVTGLSHHSDVAPWKMRRLYEARGYVPYAESFSKVL